MKILMIYSPLYYMIPTEVPEAVNQSRGFLPPLGLLYIAASVRKYSRHTVSVLDTQVEKLSFAEIRRRIVQEKPDIVGIHAQTFSFVDAMRTAQLSKSVGRNIIVVMGGPHVSVYPEETVSSADVDYVVIGEGEEVFVKLLDQLSQGERAATCEGVVSKAVLSPQDKPTAVVIQNLDDLPLPDRTLLPYKRYYSILSRKYPVTTMITSRGCPYGCVFCHESRKPYRAASPQRVVAEMQECVRLGIGEIFIHDDTFTVDRKRVMAICEAILQKGLRIDWDARARVDTVDRELLLMMKKAGCVRISYGVESGSQRILDNLKKGIAIEQITDALRYTREAGITILADFMIGSPGEGVKEIQETLELMKRTAPDFVHFSLVTPYPGTALYASGLQRGIIARDYWKEFAQNPTATFVPPVWEECLKREELVHWINKAYTTHYMDLKYVLKSVRTLKSLRELRDKTGAFLRLCALKGSAKSRNRVDP